MKTPMIVMYGILLAATGSAESIPALTIDQALATALQNSPELRAARMNTQAAEKAVEASGRWKNPYIDFEAEGVGGDLDGFNDTEYTIGLWQTFEFGGKRKHARAVAQESIGIASEAEAEKELALLADVRLAFIEVMAQQEIAKVREAQEALGRAFVNVAQARFEAGGASEMDVVQAELQLQEILLSQTCCLGDLEAARIRLASLIGISETAMGELSADYYTLETVEPSTISASHPSLKRMDARIAATRSRAQLAKAKDAVDINLGAGYRYEASDDSSTFVLGASMPLVFVRSGRAEEAAQLVQADALGAQREEMRRLLQQQLAMITARYKGAKREAEMTRDRLVPKAEKAYELSQEGYSAGRYSWVELITSQQHLAEIRVREVEALKAAHFARAELYRFMNEGM